MGEVYNEQPQMKYTGKIYGQFLFTKEYEDGGAKLQERVQFDYCTLRPIRKNIQNSLSPPDIQTVAVDADFDGVVDHYNISMRIKKPDDALRLSKMDLIIAFDYKLSSIIKLKMEGLAILSVDTLASSALNPATIKTAGTMRFIQPNSLKQLPNGASKTVYDDDFFDTLEHTNIRTFLETYLTERNETLHYDYKQTVSYGPADQSYVDVNMVFRIPNQ